DRSAASAGGGRVHLRAPRRARGRLHPRCRVVWSPTLSAVGELCIVGQGRVGVALSQALRAAGVSVTAHAARQLPARLDAATYLLCVRDPSIEEVARAVIARHAGPAPTLLHTAGGVPSERLRAA